MERLTAMLGLGGSVNLDIILDPNDRRKFLKFRENHKSVKLPIYSGSDDISGVVAVELKGTNRYEHLGLRIEIVGHLEIYSDKNLCTNFMSMSKELEPAGFLTENRSFPFKFPRFEKQYQTFNGIAGRVRYFLRVTLNRNYNTNITKEADFAVQIPTPELDSQPATPIKLEVGIDDCLHIEFEYTKTQYHLKDCIVGRVLFHQMKVQIKSMELCIVRKESFGTGETVKHEIETLEKFEIMDGCPIKDEIVPIRLYLSGVDLTPSYKNINNRLQVKHFVNLVLIDQDDRKYFKQHDIEIYRRK